MSLCFGICFTLYFFKLLAGRGFSEDVDSTSRRTRLEESRTNLSDCLLENTSSNYRHVPRRTDVWEETQNETSRVERICQIR